MNGTRLGWIVFGLLCIALLAGGGVILNDHAKQTVAGAPQPGEVQPGEPIRPSAPAPPVSFPAVPTPIPRTLPTPDQSPPGGSISVAGSHNKRTLACNESTAFISGVDNTVTLTGHCSRVDISGVQNTVTVNTSDTIVVSGVRNTVIFLTGAPQLAKTGIDNTINGS